MAPRKRVPARVRTRARIGGAAAHNGPGSGPAHTEDNETTAAVFHAPMFALNADAE